MRDERKIGTIIKDYIICGPFPREILLFDGAESFYKDFLLELGGEHKAIFKEDMKIEGAKCFRISTDDGVVDLAELFGEEFKKYWKLRFGVAYAYTQFYVEKPCKAVFLLGAEDYATVYLNGKRIFTTHVAKKYKHGFHAFGAYLRKGVNHILLKIGRYAGRWLFSLEIIPTTKPIYVNTNRIVAPQIIKGERAKIWVGIQILALDNIKRLKITCEEDDVFCESTTILNDIKEFEILNIPLLIVSKRKVEMDKPINVRITICADEFMDELILPLEVTPLKKGAHIVLTYRSKADNSVQMYGCKLPTDDTNKKFAMIVALHGFKGIPTLSQVFGDKDWCIIISPTARGEVPYQEIGLIEVLEVIQEAKKRFNIDEDRIFLLGHSMGGYGTWLIGSLFPHKFAAIVPLSSRGDLSYKLEKIRNLPSWAGVVELIERYNPINFVENLIATPVFISHGSEDPIVPVDESRKMAKVLTKLGIEHIYEEVANKPHVWGEVRPRSRYGLEAVDRESIERFLIQKKRKIPTKIIAKTLDPRFNLFWWIEINRMSSKQALIEAEIVEQNKIIIRRVMGINEFSIRIRDLVSFGLIDPTENIVIRFADLNTNIILDKLSKSINRLSIAFDENKNILVKLDENIRMKYCQEKCSITTEIVSASKQPELRKAPPVCGPFMDIFNSPTILVPGSAKFAELNMKIARHLQHWWVDFANGFLKIFYDYEVLENKYFNNYNILCIGGPEVNRVVSHVIDTIPIRIEGNTISIDDLTFKGEEFGVALIYPNPLNKAKYIAILGSNSALSIEALERLDPTLIPDILIYDSRFLGVDLRGVVYSKFFDENWK